MKKNNYISKKELIFLSENLLEPRTPTFYGLPKIHKHFEKFPPLRPIVSGYNTCTNRLSENLDSFLKYQAQRAHSYVHDTKDFLNHLSKVKNLPTNSSLITMDVGSLYTNIDHEEGANACFHHLEKRHFKSIPSCLLKRLILLVLESNTFRFGKSVYHQIKGTAMGSPMAPNYANLFMATLEEEIIQKFYEQTGLRPLIYLRYIDDVFMIWTHNDNSLKNFIKFANEYTDSKNMKSNIKFEVNISKEKVNFLDVEITLSDQILHSNVYSKPTDAHLYLNAYSCHPAKTIKNIPEGQFIRIRRICSNYNDFMRNANLLISQFCKQGYSIKKLQETLNDVKNMNRIDLLKESVPKTSDPQSIFVCTWHPKLKPLASIFQKNFQIIQQDHELNKIFQNPPLVSFRRKKNIANHVIRNDIDIEKQNKLTSKCGKCKICPSLATSNQIRNNQTNISVSLNSGSNCKSKNVIYAAKCKKHSLIYVGHTGESLQTRFSKHRYDCKERPQNSELAEHFFKDHDFEKDMEIYILQNNIKDINQRKHLEDRWMCKLQTQHPTGLNKDCGSYLKEMYSSWTSCIN